MNTIAIINIAKAELGLDDDTYRTLLVRVTGKTSLRQMSERQRIDVVEEMKRKGFRIRASRAAKPLPKAFQPHSRLIHALWKNCHSLGVIENPSREALRAFCKRFVAHGLDHVVVDPDLLDRAQATPIIEALKKMEARGKAAQSGAGQ
ncbi:gp16 family protein [Tabrizicola fusiformis]|uniref:gp16 family protein n=1 Tax=Tabrizicola sp. SY72 TaxID=2741673 RepID=UPI0015748457|nr:regulatory protein GemA [Tabrizicola sp. SY72]NTT88248.1 regulatory protein GemA [Tabrizicola sp. SY72]